MVPTTIGAVQVARHAQRANTHDGMIVWGSGHPAPAGMGVGAVVPPEEAGAALLVAGEVAGAEVYHVGFSGGVPSHTAALNVAMALCVLIHIVLGDMFK